MTGQRTHRYLRLSLVGVVFALAVAVTVETVRTVCARHGLEPEIVDIDGVLELERRYREAIIAALSPQ